jgi:hypothetical protein
MKTNDKAKKNKKNYPPAKGQAKISDYHLNEMEVEKRFLIN